MPQDGRLTLALPVLREGRQRSELHCDCGREKLLFYLNVRVTFSHHAIELLSGLVHSNHANLSQLFLLQELLVKEEVKEAPRYRAVPLQNDRFHQAQLEDGHKVTYVCENKNEKL